MSGSTGGRALVAVLTVGACVGLVACTSGAGSPGTLPPAPPVSSAPATSPAATPTPSSQTDEAAIEAAVRDYFDAVNTAITGGGTSNLASASTADCPCKKLVSTVDRLFLAGAIKGASWEIQTVNVGAPTRNRSVSTVRYTTAPYTTVDSAGRMIKSFAGYSIESSVVVVSQGNQWLVRSFDTLSRVES